MDDARQARLDVLPQEFPAAMAEDTFLEGFDHLRHHWKSLAEGARKEAAP